MLGLKERGEWNLKKVGAVFAIVIILLLSAIVWMVSTIHKNGVREQNQADVLSAAKTANEESQKKILDVKMEVAKEAAEAKRLAGENAKFSEALAVCAQKDELRRVNAETAKLKRKQEAKLKHDRLAKLKRAKPKVAVAEVVDKISIVSQAIKSCAERGGELVSENGKVMCVPKVAQQPEPVQTTPQKVAQLGTSKVGTPCPGDGYRSATYQMINGQLACLLDGVVRVTESYHRPEPEVVYVDRVIREERAPSREEEVYYEEDRGSSVLPWVIGGGALLWALNRNTSPAATVQGRAPAGVLTGRTPAGVLGGAW